MERSSFRCILSSKNANARTNDDENRRSPLQNPISGVLALDSTCCIIALKKGVPYGLVLW